MASAPFINAGLFSKWDITGIPAVEASVVSTGSVHMHLTEMASRVEPSTMDPPET